jgi:mannose-6-phosphate isomerase-like protein (cupin superfamily)
MTSPHLPLLPPRSSAQGVEVMELDFDASPAKRRPFSASRFTLEPGSRSRLDRHAAHECWMIAAGSGTLVFEERSVPIRSGEVCYFPPFASHQAYNDGSGRLEIFSVWWSDPA